jgi:type IV pilus assembly protein PilW
MNVIHPSPIQRAPAGILCSEQGFTLVELMVAMAIALFLMGGLLALVQGTRRAFGGQNQLAQLQDSERLAMTMITDVIQAAGYFPNPTGTTAANALPAAGSFVTPGQAIYGQSNVTAQGDTITARYQTASGDNIINCVGQTNGSGGPLLYVNTFSVIVVAGQVQLACALGVGAAAPAAPVPLITGLQQMQIWYGVKTNFAVADYTADTYLPASSMTNVNWTNVTSVRVQLTFNNPLWVAANPQGQPQFIPFTRVIGVMNRAGVKT